MSRKQAATGGVGDHTGGGAGKLALLIVFLVALIGGGYLTYRDLVTPFSQVEVTVVDTDAADPDASAVPAPEPATKPTPTPAPDSRPEPAADAPADASADMPAEAPVPTPAPTETRPDTAVSDAAEEPRADAADTKLAEEPRADAADTEPVEEPRAGAADTEPVEEPRAVAADTEPVEEPRADAAAAPTVATGADSTPATAAADPGPAEPSADQAVAPAPAPRPQAVETAAARPPDQPDPTPLAGNDSAGNTAGPDPAPSAEANAPAVAAPEAPKTTPPGATEKPPAAPPQDAAAAPQLDAGPRTAAITAPGTEQDAGVAATSPLTRRPAPPPEAVPTPRPVPDATAGQQPSFDIIRIDSSGSGLVAGRAAPGSTVQILAGESVVATAEASAAGEFVAFVQTPAADEGQVLSLAVGEGATAAASTENVLILPSAEDGAAPTVVKATEDDVRVVQASPLGRVDGVTLDSISYDQSGAVKLAGRAPRAQAIRVYVDGTPEAATRSSEAGTWDARLESVDAGRYVLRIDALAEDGTVESRAETPFQRVYPPAGQSAGPTQITVQPGNTLWVMARDKYGSGLLYTQIFAANRDAIRDPDLIYPGQIFTLPSEDEVGR